MQDDEGVEVMAEIAESFCYLTPIGATAVLTLVQCEMVIALGYEELGTEEGERLRGTAFVFLSYGMPNTLGANMLGCPDQSRVTLELASDAAFELANVLTGNLLPRIFGAQREFQLSSPRLAPYPMSMDLVSFSLATEEGSVTWALCEKPAQP